MLSASWSAPRGPCSGQGGVAAIVLALVDRGTADGRVDARSPPPRPASVPVQAVVVLVVPPPLIVHVGVPPRLKCGLAANAAAAVMAAAKSTAAKMIEIRFMLDPFLACEFGSRPPSRRSSSPIAFRAPPPGVADEPESRGGALAASARRPAHRLGIGVAQDAQPSRASSPRCGVEGSRSRRHTTAVPPRRRRGGRSHIRRAPRFRPPIRRSEVARRAPAWCSAARAGSGAWRRQAVRDAGPRGVVKGSRRRHRA